VICTVLDRGSDQLSVGENTRWDKVVATVGDIINQLAAVLLL
jgi:hypothetical protein